MSEALHVLSVAGIIVGTLFAAVILFGLWRHFADQRYEKRMQEFRKAFNHGEVDIYGRKR
jgi:hypothetical protein